MFWLEYFLENVKNVLFLRRPMSTILYHSQPRNETSTIWWDSVMFCKCWFRSHTLSSVYQIKEGGWTNSLKSVYRTLIVVFRRDFSASGRSRWSRLCRCKTVTRVEISYVRFTIAFTDYGFYARSSQTHALLTLWAKFLGDWNIWASESAFGICAPGIFFERLVCRSISFGPLVM